MSIEIEQIITTDRIPCRLPHIPHPEKGQIALEVLFFSIIAVILLTGFVFLAASFLKISVRAYNKVQAFEVAESGIEYYRWHLAHAPSDFQDGTGKPGPYVHNYYDKDGNLIGQFALDVTAPPNGSTVVTIRSTGTVMADSSVKKIIQVQMGIPSFAQYAFAANDNMRFGSGTVVYGQIYTNGGVHFDGVAHNLVQSAQTTYVDPDNGLTEWGVYTQTPPADPQPPTPVATNTAVFMAGRTFPVPALNFNGITQTLSSLQSQAQSGGVYASSSGAFGYDLAFSTSTATTTYTLYKVTALTAPPNNCTNPGQTGWGTWSVKNETQIATGTIPANGIFYFSDNLWVRGQINNARVTVASGVLPNNPTTNTSITVNSNLLYTNYNGSDTLALIGQNNVNVGMVSSDTMRIDGALVSQNGRVGRYYYGSSCAPYNIRAQLTLYGMIGSALRYGFAYTNGTGYQNRIIVYDSNLLYGPPPSFPLSASQYQQISWQEVQ